MAALAIGTLILGVLFLSRPKRITLDNVNKIQVGMSEAELTEMLGPSGDYSSRPWISHASNAPNAAYCRQWISDDCALFVEFDSKDRVITYTMSAGLKRDWLSWLDWLRP
jgi:hypothetical protein